MTHKTIIKLNLGCGPSGIDSWLNFDWGVLPILSKLTWLRKFLVKVNVLPPNYDIFWSKIKLVDIKKRLPLDDNSVDYIYCSHVLEHFEKYETRSILNECYRVLKKNGIMRIVLPDLKQIVSNYGEADGFNRIYFGYDKDKKSIFNFFIRGHQWMYDIKSICLLLKPIFSRIEVKKFGFGGVPDLDKLDLKMHKNHSLYVEVIK